MSATGTKLSASELLQKLIQCPSVTPEEGGALTLLEEVLTPLGFHVQRLTFSEEGEADVENLYARYGYDGPHLMFAGHTDVVPVGDEAAWQHPPFSGAIEDNVLYGRGAVDMKGGIACFISAFTNCLAQNGAPKGSVSLLITGDEEGIAINGTEKLLKYLDAKGESWDGAIVGEPTNPENLGDMIKIGRRGSLSGRVNVKGKQGHVAYPHLADNPINSATSLMAALIAPKLDAGTERFPPTNLEITSVDVGNSATNVIPGNVTFQFNVRFNDTWSETTLKAEITRRLDEAAKEKSLRDKPDAVDYDLDFGARASQAFLTKDKKLIETMSIAVDKVMGVTPQLSTTGGTSDARFIKDYCPVVEFGLVGQTMHMVDERVALDDVENLTKIYGAFLDNWFD